jgi:hypothetical protein
MKEAAGPAAKISTMDQASVIPTGWRDSTDSIHIADTRAGSDELLQRLADLVDGIVRLSNTTEHLPIDIRQSSSWTIVEHAHKLLSVSGASSEIQLKPVTEDALSLIPK